MPDFNNQRKELDTPETKLIGADEGVEGVLVQFEFVYDTRKGPLSDEVKDHIYQSLTQQFKNYCIQQHWFPTGNGPDFTVAEQDWEGLPLIRRHHYATKYNIGKKHAKIFRIFGYVVPKGTNAAPLPTDKIKLNNYDGEPKNSAD